MFEASEKYKHIKFLKIVATKCIENYPDQNVPTLVIYFNGGMVATLPRIDKKYRKFTLAAIEDTPSESQDPPQDRYLDEGNCTELQK
jgi:hypothetical protein